LERNITYQHYVLALEPHPAGDATVALCHPFDNVSIFTMDTNIFKWHSYRVYLGFVRWVGSVGLGLVALVGSVIILWQYKHH